MWPVAFDHAAFDSVRPFAERVTALPGWPTVAELDAILRDRLAFPEPVALEAQPPKSKHRRRRGPVEARRADTGPRGLGGRAPRTGRSRLLRPREGPPRRRRGRGRRPRGRGAYHDVVQALRGHLLPRPRPVPGARTGALDPRRGAAMVPYTMSKAAVAALTVALAEELAPARIGVNAVAPSILDTPANRAAMPAADVSKWVRLADLAETMLFLASPACQASGTLVPVYGRA